MTGEKQLPLPPVLNKEPKKYGLVVSPVPVLRPVTPPKSQEVLPEAPADDTSPNLAALERLRRDLAEDPEQNQ